MKLSRQNVNMKENNVTMYGDESGWAGENNATYAGNTSGMMGQPVGDGNYKISHGNAHYW